MYNNLKAQITDSKIKYDIKIFFEEAIRNANVNKDSWDEDKLVKRMCDAFWEDVCISADLEKILNFSERSNKRNVTRDYVLSELMLYYNTLSGIDDVIDIEDKLLEIKKYIDADIWKMLLPFFIYVESDIDLDNLNNYTLDIFKRNNFIYSLALLTGDDRSYERKSIIITVFDKMEERIKINERGYYKNLLRGTKKCDSFSDCSKKDECRYFLLINYLKKLKADSLKRLKIDNLEIVLDLIYDLYNDLELHGSTCEYFKNQDINEILELSAMICVSRREHINFKELQDESMEFLKEKGYVTREIIFKMVEEMKKYEEYFRCKVTKFKAFPSVNFKYVKELMEYYKERGTENGYVVYCFNILTDWFGYSLYLNKKDTNIFNYNGLALKVVAEENFCLDTGKSISYKLTNGFWEKAEELRKNMIGNLISNWNIQKDVKYERHMELYDKVLEDNLNLGNNMDFLEYWIERFKEEEDSEW